MIQYKRPLKGGIGNVQEAGEEEGAEERGAEEVDCFTRVNYYFTLFSLTHNTNNPGEPPGYKAPTGGLNQLPSSTRGKCFPLLY